MLPLAADNLARTRSPANDNSGSAPSSTQALPVDSQLEQICDPLGDGRATA